MNFRIDSQPSIRTIMRLVYQAVCNRWDGRALNVSVTLAESQRSLDQNAKMWAMLRDISEQVEWYGQRLKDYEWKCVITAHLSQQKMVPGIEGGFVAIGQRTSKMSIKAMSDVIECCYWFGAEKGVEWTDPKVIEMLRHFEMEAA